MGVVQRLPSPVAKKTSDATFACATGWEEAKPDLTCPICLSRLMPAFQHLGNTLCNFPHFGKRVYSSG